MTNTATVETLTAEVRVLMVGSRQVTASVFKQLDECPVDSMNPIFGRVRSDGAQWIIGRSERDGTLVRCHQVGDWEYEYGDPYKDRIDLEGHLVSTPRPMTRVDFERLPLIVLVGLR